MNTLQVRFDIVDEPTEIRLAFTGDEYPWMPVMTVLNNTRFRILDMTTGQYVFELLRDGTETNRNRRLRWAQQTWVSTLPVGQYRLEMRGSGDAQYDAGGGSDYAPYGNGGVEFSLSVTIPECAADFNGDGFVDFFDYNDFVACFELNDCPAGRNADFNGDGFADFFDYADYVAAFEAGC